MILKSMEKCMRGATDWKDNCCAGSGLCLQCRNKRLFRFEALGRIFCSGRWTKKDQADYEKRLAAYKQKYPWC